jgi:outer membrane protein assembly factor BamD (BamD/ComL family)
LRALGATALVLFFAAVLSISCATKLPPIPEETSSAELIQKAQERSDIYDWKGAQYYYKALLEKFPNDQVLVVTSMYELAYIEYKQGHYDAAHAGLAAVIEKYATPEGASLPQTWKILAEKVLTKLPIPAKKLPVL